MAKTLAVAVTVAVTDSLMVSRKPLTHNKVKNPSAAGSAEPACLPQVIIPFFYSPTNLTRVPIPRCWCWLVGGSSH